MNNELEIIVGKQLHFTQYGTYVVYKNRNETGEKILDDTNMLAHMHNFRHGWVKWNNSQPVEYIVGYATENYKPLTRRELGNTNIQEWEQLNGHPIDPWQRISLLIMYNQDQPYTFTTSSQGGIFAVADLCGSYGKRRRLKPNEMPMIQLHAKWYWHSKLSKRIFTPVFRIVDWINHE